MKVESKNLKFTIKTENKMGKELITLKTEIKKKNASWKKIFVLDNFNLNVLSFARLFLFASRDFWFEVPVSVEK